MSQNDNYCKYLAFILVMRDMEGIRPEIRQLAGLILKTQI